MKCLMGKVVKCVNDGIVMKWLEIYVMKLVKGWENLVLKSVEEDVFGKMNGV